MSAGTFGSTFPPVVTLDDLAAMNAADQHGHRYELSPEGALFVMPPPGSEHAVIASRLQVWLAMAGWAPEQVLQAVGLRISGAGNGIGGRVPDLTIWARALPSVVWADVSDLLLAVEIVSPGSAPVDKAIKTQEYAAAGIPRYWIVDSNPAQTVTMYVLGENKSYEVAAKMPLAWLLQTDPAQHLDG